MYCLSLRPSWTSSWPNEPESWCPATASKCWTSLIRTSCRDQVDEREDDDPHDVDEVPVQTDELDHFGLVPGDPVVAQHHREREQHDDAQRDVHAVEAGERVEARREQARGVAEALAVERRELVRLATDERGAQDGRGDEPDPGVALVAAA